MMQRGGVGCVQHPKTLRGVSQHMINLEYQFTFTYEKTEKFPVLLFSRNMTVTCGTQLEGSFREDAEILPKNQTRGQNPPRQPVHLGNYSHERSPSQ